HACHAPVLVDHDAELPVAQTRHQRPHPRELACVRRHEGAIQDDQTTYREGVRCYGSSESRCATASTLGTPFSLASCKSASIAARGGLTASIRMSARHARGP